ncbi:MAG: hypothetical protein WD733_07020 [Bryobacterales bacterium]
MTRLACLLLLALVPGLPAETLPSSRTHFVILSGLGGEPLYEKRFAEQVKELEKVARRNAGDASLVHALSGEAATRKAIEELFARLKKDVAPEDSLAVVLLGHGSYDGYDYKLNVPGPDITGERLRVLFEGVPAERQLVVNTTSASGAVMELWKSDKRVVVAATKNGRERTATTFAQFFVEALASAEADTDKSESITAQEAYTYAERKVKDFYESEMRLATEHSRMEGELAGSFTLARLGKALEAAADPATREMMARREALEQQVGALKLRKESMAEQQYFDELQKVLIELAQLQTKIDDALGQP